MRVTTKLFLVSVLAALVLAPDTARADGFVIPWIGGNVGSRAAGGFGDYGVSVGYTAASMVDFDVDFDYSPDFYRIVSRVMSSRPWAMSASAFPSGRSMLLGFVPT
jgi:hypothetical protein